jgi:Na+/phosphate symporter
LTIKLSNISAERSYSVEELKGLSSSVEIAKAIIDLLSSEFLSNECEITEQYLKATENLKKLENKIEEERVVWE